MHEIWNTQQKFSNNIEIECIKIIEDKLNTFFDSCIKNSLKYTVVLSENSGYYSEDNFKKMVLSSLEIENLIVTIFLEINNNYNQNLKLLKLNSNIINNLELNSVLIDSIKEYNHSLKIITHCENIINKTISKSLNLGSVNRVISYIIKGKNIGAFILGSNNYFNTQCEYRKEVNNQIKGILLNTKYAIKNQLINYIIRTLKTDELKCGQEFMITA